jgi:hypothetical protein
VGYDEINAARLGLWNVGKASVIMGYVASSRPSFDTGSYRSYSERCSQSHGAWPNVAAIELVHVLMCSSASSGAKYIAFTTTVFM